MADKRQANKVSFKEALDNAKNLNEEILNLSNSFSESLSSSKSKADLRKKLEQTGRAIASILQNIIVIKQDIED